MSTTATETPGTASPSPVRIRRIFMYGTQRLADPNPGWKPNEVKNHYASSMPDLTSASITLENTEEKDGVKIETWQLKRSVGTKG